MRKLRVRFYCQHLDGSGQVTLRDGQRLSDLLNLPDHFLKLDQVTTETPGKGDRSLPEGILLSKPVIFMLVPIGRAQREEMGLANESMRVHKTTSRLAIYLPGWRVRAAIHHVTGANLAQHLDLRGDSFIPLTDVYAIGSLSAGGKKPTSFRAGFALLNKHQAVAVRLKAPGKILSLKAAMPAGPIDATAASRGAGGF